MANAGTLEIGRTTCETVWVVVIGRLVSMKASGLRTSHTDKVCVSPSPVIAPLVLCWGPSSHWSPISSFQLIVGVFVLEGVSRYEGQMEEGEYHGSGVLQLEGGVVYEGEFSYGQYNGQGVLVTGDRFRYEGTWMTGKYHGEGELTEYFTGDSKR
jgi:MORN repeat